MFSFTVTKALHQARLSHLQTPHGIIEGPFFQFVATQAGIRGQVYSEDLERLEAQVVLCNTFHLHLRPGEDIVAEAGGLHGFMQWNKPMTTDSGGYQVFSLQAGQSLDEDGVTFRSPLDGSPQRLTPETAIAIQNKLGADIIMPLDVCTPFDAPRERIAAAVEQTIRWAQRCFEAHTVPTQLLYGIVQGGLHADLRQQCATALQEIGFAGFSIGGELRDATDSRMVEGIAMTVSHLPPDKPRYLMGAGTPEDILRAVRLGIDQFDCVLPIRNARHGKVYRNLNVAEVRRCLLEPDYVVDPGKLYETLDIQKSRYARDASIFSPHNPAIEKPYTVGYVHHLMRAEAPSGFRLAVLNNIFFYVTLLSTIRQVIKEAGTEVIVKT